MRSVRWCGCSPTTTWCTSTARSIPQSDIEVIETELILADMQTLEKAVPRLEKEARNNKDRKPVHEAAVAAQQILDGGTTLFAAGVRTRRCCAS